MPEVVIKIQFFLPINMIKVATKRVYNFFKIYSNKFFFFYGSFDVQYEFWQCDAPTLNKFWKSLFLKKISRLHIIAPLFISFSSLPKNHHYLGGISASALNRVSRQTFMFLYRDLSYGEILAGRPGAWLVKKIFLYACNQKSLKRNLGWNSKCFPEHVSILW